jgi:hypothetical protein
LAKSTSTASGHAPVAGKPWIASYPANVPAEIEVPPGSIGDLLVASCR